MAPSWSPFGKEGTELVTQNGECFAARSERLMHYRVASVSLPKKATICVDKIGTSVRDSLAGVCRHGHIPASAERLVEGDHLDGHGLGALGERVLGRIQ